MKPPSTTNWRLAADRLAASIPKERLHPRVVATAEASPRATWGVAFSGGPDSLALLLLLKAHWPKRRLLALHFNHRLRGRASDGDEKFCAQVCRALGVRFLADRWRGDHADASEAEARAARMKFFARHVRVLWLGHQQDDIAETMLMRLSRGSGTGGLAAPRPVQPMPNGRIHLRPLLGIKRAEIQAGLQEAGVGWREDATNAKGFFFRNRIRREVLPAWTKAAQRDALAGAALSRTLLEEDDAALQAWLEELDLNAGRGRLALEKLAGKPRALARRALHRWLQHNAPGVELSRQAFDALLEAVERGRPTRHSLGREGFALIRRGTLSREKVGKRNRPAN
jgi:tRNA(Ile)-lysidine synthase